MVTDAMVTAAWRALPGYARTVLEADDVRRAVAAAIAESKAGEDVPQRPDAEGEW